METFSTPLMRLIEYDLDDLGQMTVPSETGCLTDDELVGSENAVRSGYTRG
jgi:hypothetical protein